jgi:hypothetical protein
MDKLTRDQARALCDALQPMGGYLCRLVERMDRTNLSLRDPKLYQLVRAAEDAMHHLWVELHYQSCGHGVGRPPAPVTGRPPDESPPT